MRLALLLCFVSSLALAQSAPSTATCHATVDSVSVGPATAGSTVTATVVLRDAVGGPILRVVPVPLDPAQVPDIATARTLLATAAAEACHRLRLDQWLASRAAVAAQAHPTGLVGFAGTVAP